MISSLASISSDAKIAENARIDSFSTIFEDVVIGKNSHIHPNVTIYPGTRIGENCEIFPGAVIGVVPQDLKFDGENTTVEIGDNTKIRECVTIHRGTKDKLTTKTKGASSLPLTVVHARVLARQLPELSVGLAGGAGECRAHAAPHLTLGGRLSAPGQTNCC